MNEKFNVKELIESIGGIVKERDKYAQLLEELANPETSPFQLMNVIFGKLETLAEAAGLYKSADFATLKKRVSEEHSQLKGIEDRIGYYKKHYNAEVSYLTFTTDAKAITSTVEEISKTFNLLWDYLTYSSDLIEDLQKVNSTLPEKNKLPLDTLKNLFESASAACERLTGAYQQLKKAQDTIKRIEKHESALKSVLGYPPNKPIEESLGFWGKDVPQSELEKKVRERIEELYRQEPVLKFVKSPLWKRLAWASMIVVAGIGMGYFLTPERVVPKPYPVYIYLKCDIPPCSKPRMPETESPMMRRGLEEVLTTKVVGTEATPNQPPPQDTKAHLRYNISPKPVLDINLDCPDSVTVTKDGKLIDTTCTVNVSYADSNENKIQCDFSCNDGTVLNRAYKIGEKSKSPRLHTFCSKFENTLTVQMKCQYSDGTWSEPNEEIIKVVQENAAPPAEKTGKKSATPKPKENAVKGHNACGYETVVDDFTKPPYWSSFRCVPRRGDPKEETTPEGCYTMNQYINTSLREKFNLSSCNGFCCSPEAKQKYLAPRE